MRTPKAIETTRNTESEVVNKGVFGEELHRRKSGEIDMGEIEQRG